LVQVVVLVAMAKVGVQVAVVVALVVVVEACVWVAVVMALVVVAVLGLCYFLG